MNFKKKLLTLLSLLFLIMPQFVYAYSDKLLLGGHNVGIEVSAKEITVAGFYKVNDNFIAKDAGLKLGDKIIAIDGIVINSVDEMIKVINNNVNEGKIDITIKRLEQEKNVTLRLVKDSNNIYKTGIYVKDQITGIGTLTYIDPNTKIFGALGHEIIDNATSKRIEIKGGKIFKSSITGTVKSTENTTGEKNAIFYSNNTYGQIVENTTSGIFGVYEKNISDFTLVDVGSPDDIKLGKAHIMTVISGEKVEKFEIEILRVNKENHIKNILFQITDSTLIDKTNGVIKGMSGSPIVQDNKIIGAVTHAIVNDDGNKGYGIFITTMLEEGEN